jgi:hypothetical protein
VAWAPESLIKSQSGEQAMSAKHDDDADLYVRPFSITLLLLVSLAVAAVVAVIILLTR